jgi:hypothetical protein
MVSLGFCHHELLSTCEEDPSSSTAYEQGLQHGFALVYEIQPIVCTWFHSQFCFGWRCGYSAVIC